MCNESNYISEVSEGSTYIYYFRFKLTFFRCRGGQMRKNVF